MGWKSVIRRGIEVTTGYTVVKKPRPTAAPEIPYDQDGLRSFHNHDFVADPAFARAYARGNGNGGCTSAYGRRALRRDSTATSSSAE